MAEELVGLSVLQVLACHTPPLEAIDGMDLRLCVMPMKYVSGNPEFICKDVRPEIIIHIVMCVVLIPDPPSLLLVWVSDSLSLGTRLS